MQVRVFASQELPSGQQNVPQTRLIAQHVVPPRQDSPVWQHWVLQAGWANPQHRFSDSMQLSSSPQHAFPHALSGSQQSPSPRQVSELAQHLSSHDASPVGQQRLAASMHESVASQQVFPQTSSGWQHVPALGPVSMQASVFEQQLSPTHGVFPGLQHSPMEEFKQVSSVAQQATSPQLTGQHGAPVALHPSTQTPYAMAHPATAATSHTA